jgi:hypothetical protein
MERHLTILALDPGGTTGWSVFEIDLDRHGVAAWEEPPVPAAHFSNFGQLSNPSDKEGHHQLLWRLLSKFQPNVIICERFDNSGNEFAKIISAQYIGVVTLWAELHDGTLLVMQGADQAKSWAKGKLALLGILLHPVDRWKHANDANKHLLYFLCNQNYADRYPGIRMRMLRALKEVL